MNNKKPSPHFGDAASEQRVTNCEAGVFELTSWLIPGTEDSQADTGKTGRAFYLDIHAMRDADPERTAAIRREYEHRRTAESPDGSKLGYRIINPSVTEFTETTDVAEATIGIMSPWSTYADWETVFKEAEALALIYPKCKIVYIDTPGMGDSSALTNERHEQLKRGSYAPMAKQIVDCLNQTNLQFDILAGRSEGGRAVISVASLLKKRNPNKELLVVTQDPPGTHEQPTIKLAANFTLAEGSAQQAVMRNSPDTTVVEAHNKKDSRLSAAALILGGRSLYGARQKAMARGGLRTDVTDACNNGVKIIDFRAGGSAIANTSVAENLASITPGYTTINLINAPHAIVETNPFAFALLIAQAVDMSNLPNHIHSAGRLTLALKLGQIAAEHKK